MGEQHCHMGEFSHDELSGLVVAIGVDRQGCITRWSSRVAHVTGWRAEEVLGTSLVKTLVPEPSRERVRDNLADALSSEEPAFCAASVILRLLGKNQQVYELLVCMTCLESDEGEVDGVLIAGQDITQYSAKFVGGLCSAVGVASHPAALSAVSGTIDDLTHLFAAADAMVFSVDSDCSITDWNLRAETVTGCSKAEAMGKSFTDTFSVDACRADLKEAFSSALAGKDVFGHEVTLLRGSANDLCDPCLCLNIVARRGADGTVAGAICVGRTPGTVSIDSTALPPVAAGMESEGELSRLIESASAPMFCISPDGLIQEWNDKLTEITGYEKQEVVGRHLVDEFVILERRELIQEELDEARRGAEVANLEFPLHTKHGKPTDMLLHAVARTDESGRVVGIVGIGNDISDLRQELSQEFMDVVGPMATETAPSKVLDFLQYVEQAEMPYMAIDNEFRIVEWNSKAAEVSGWGEKEVVGRSVFQGLVQHDFKKDAKSALTKLVSGRGPSSTDVPIASRGDEPGELVFTLTRRVDRNGATTGMYGIGRDTTALRAAENDRTCVAEDLARLVATANAPILGVDVDGYINEWNRMLEELTGYSRSEVAGRALEQLLANDSKAQASNVISRACQGLETAVFEMSLIGKGNRIVRLMMNATSRMDADGYVTGVVSVGQDIAGSQSPTSGGASPCGSSPHFASVTGEELASFVAAASAPVFGIDVHGQINEWNSAATKLTGYDRDSMLGESLVVSVVQVDQQDSARDALDRALRGLPLSRFELHLQTRKGEQREVFINALSRRGPCGEIMGLLLIGHDVTELNSRLQRAESQAADFSRLIETANTPILRVDHNVCVTEWNQKAVDLTGYSRSEIVGKKLVQTIVAEASRQEVAGIIGQVLQGDERSEFDFPVVTKTGELRELVMNATSLSSPGGDSDAVTGVLFFGYDITEVHQKHRESRTAADDLARLIDKANAPIIGCNMAGEVTEWNEKAAALTGYTREEALGKPFVESFVRQEDCAEVAQTIFDACNGTEMPHFEVSMIHRDGTEVFLLLSATPQKDASGNIVGMFGVGQDFTTLRQAVFEVSSAADDMKRIVEYANAPIFGIDADGKITEWNRKLTEISEYTQEEMMGKPLLETFIHEGCRDEVGKVLSDALAGVETQNYELPFYTKSGDRHDILFNATARRSASGDITGVVGVGEDITKLRRIVKDNEKAAADLTRLIENANAPIFGIGTTGLITVWNKKAAQISGYPKEVAMGRHLVKQIIHRSHKKDVQGMLDQVLSGKEVENFELAMYTSAGERRELLLNATPRRRSGDDDTNVIGVVCVGQDITLLNEHRTRAERIAHDLSQLIETANAPIFGVGVDMCIIEWNGWVARKSGWRKEDVIGRNTADFISESSYNIVEQVMYNATHSQPCNNFELELRGAGQEKPVCLLLNATPRLSPQGDIVGIICVGQDITNIKEIELKKSNFMATVSHELKSPIHGIIGLSSTIAVGPDTPKSMLRPLQLIHSCATRLLDMVSNIMDVNVLVHDKGNLRFSRDKVQIVSIIEEVVILCRHSIDKRGVPVVKDGVSLLNDVTELPVVEADKHRCTQLLYNLITNACKFTQRGYVKVTADASDERQEVTITVEDTGIGIAPENLERVFEPFDQEDTSEKRHYEGLGLGLSISKEVAIKHGGDIEVKSVQGEGSKFTVRLPYKMAVVNDIDEVPLTLDESILDLAVERTTSTSLDLNKLVSQSQLQSVLEGEPLDRLTSKRRGSSEHIESRSLASLGNRKFSVNSGDIGNDAASVPSLATSSGGIRTQDMLDTYVQPDVSLKDWPLIQQDSSWTIVTVDDDEANQTAFSTTFGMYNKVVAMRDGQECLKYLQECETMPDLILLDVALRGMSGLEVLVEVRKQHSLLRLPIIMVSAKHSTPVLVKCLSLQCNDWIQKPVDRPEVVARIRAQLRLKELVREALVSQAREGESQASLPLALASKLIPEDLLQQAIAAGDVSEELRVELRNAIAGDLRKQYADVLDRLGTADAAHAETRRMLARAQADAAEAREALRASEEEARRLHDQDHSDAAAGHWHAPPAGASVGSQVSQELPHLRASASVGCFGGFGGPAVGCGGGVSAEASKRRVTFLPPELSEDRGASIRGTPSFQQQGCSEAALVPWLQRQNAHLSLELKQHTRSVQLLNVHLRGQEATIQALEHRILEYEACLRRLRLESALLSATAFAGSP